MKQFWVPPKEGRKFFENYSKPDYSKEMNDNLFESPAFKLQKEKQFEATAFALRRATMDYMKALKPDFKKFIPEIRREVKGADGKVKIVLEQVSDLDKYIAHQSKPDAYAVEQDIRCVAELLDVSIEVTSFTTVKDKNGKRVLEQHGEPRIYNPGRPITFKIGCNQNIHFELKGISVEKANGERMEIPYYGPTRGNGACFFNAALIAQTMVATLSELKTKTTIEEQDAIDRQTARYNAILGKEDSNKFNESVDDREETLRLLEISLTEPDKFKQIQDDHALAIKIAQEELEEAKSFSMK